MAHRWIVGDTPHLENAFKVDDTLTDPGTVSLTITDPSGASTTYTYAGGGVTKASTGVYYRNHTVSTAGKWTVQWTSTSPVADVSVESFTVHPLALDALDVLATDEARDVLKIGTLDHTQAARLASAVTAVSAALDELCGAIVKRTVTETHADPCGTLWVQHPIYSTPGITLTSYDNTGASTVYALEDFDTKPPYGYRLEARQGGGYTRKIRPRSTEGLGWWGDAVVITYTAGRFSDTGTVHPRFKEAAAVVLINWWQQVLAQPPQDGIELDLPGYRFPGFAVPNAALEILGDEVFNAPTLA